MGYYIRKLPNKKSAPTWRVQFVSRKKIDTKGSKAKNPQRTWDIPKHRWAELGFQISMTYDEARARQKQLNAQLALKRKEELRVKFEDSLKKLNLKTQGFLPEILKDEFEQRYFFDRRRETVIKNKELSHWRTAQSLIVDIKLEPTYWYEEMCQFYDWFYKRKYSFSYLLKILTILNLWGEFYAKKLGFTYTPIPRPAGFERSRLLDAYFKKNEGGKRSDPLTPEMLGNTKQNFSVAQYNWLYLSVWLGLRPNEVDKLSDDEFVRILFDKKGIPILWIYQSKLTSIPPRFRWKLIPLFLEEQRIALKIIEEGIFERPLAKTVKKYLGSNITLYGGRKGFTDLMLSINQSLENISQWMGHSTIDRTWKHYKSRIKVHYHKKAA